MNQEQAVELWKSLGIAEAIFNFNCGGDSMGDTDIVLEKENGESVENEELANYFDSEVYKNVDFYVDSDGHYQGESGTVTITLNEDDDTENPFFDYSKEALSEYSETVMTITEFELNEKQLKFIKENVENINGSKDGFVINYKKDLILSDEEEMLIKEIEDEICNKAVDFVPETDEEVSDWYTYTTNIVGEEVEVLTIIETGLKMIMTNSVTRYVDSD